MSRYKIYDYTNMKTLKDKPTLLGSFEKLTNALQRLFDIGINDNISLEDTQSPHEMNDLILAPGMEISHLIYWRDIYENGKLKEAVQFRINIDDYENRMREDYILKIKGMYED